MRRQHHLRKREEWFINFPVQVVDKKPHGLGTFSSQDSSVLKGLSEMIGRESEVQCLLLGDRKLLMPVFFFKSSAHV